jgi:hypothetical protein
MERVGLISVVQNGDGESRVNIRGRVEMERVGLISEVEWRWRE